MKLYHFFFVNIFSASYNNYDPSNLVFQFNLYYSNNFSIYSSSFSLIFLISYSG